MLRYRFIHRCSGIFFLLLFGLSITPKRFLHDLIADHRDSDHAVSRSVQEFFATGFRCHADDLVVDAPFLPQAGPVALVALPAFRFAYASPLAVCSCRPFMPSDVRGPPVLACS